MVFRKHVIDDFIVCILWAMKSSSDWRKKMKTILLSFDSTYFEKLEKNEIKFEYRKMLPDDELEVYFYVSRPIKAISGIAHFGKRDELKNWLDYFSDRPKDVISRIEDYLEDCRYVVPILDFQKTNRIPLDKLKIDICNFVVPRMYYYLDNTSTLEYLNNNLIKEGAKHINSFETISNEDICK